MQLAQTRNAVDDIQRCIQRCAVLGNYAKQKLVFKI